MTHLGIDIGTSTCVLAYVNDAGLPVAHAIDGSPLVPSAAYVETLAGRTEFGSAAVDEWANPTFDARCSFRRWKLATGDGVELGQLRTEGSEVVTPITPESLTTGMVEYLVRHATTGIGGLTAESAVVTVPHGWRRQTPGKCLATRQAASAATIDGKPLEVRPATLSEPVAAAAYALWEARRQERDDLPTRGTVLVVDIGGGTTDLSLVRLSPQGALVVLNAMNNERAGDYASALVLAGALGQAASSELRALAADAVALLSEVVGDASPALRQAFVQAQEVVHKVSLRINQAEPSGRAVLPFTATFDLSEDDVVSLRVGREDLLSTLEPFYAATRDLVAQFLNSLPQGDHPFAVVFAGGGSRIAGVRSRAVGPALEGLVPDVAQVLDRLRLNDAKVDQAVALGAALVAAGMVEVEERLLNDVGLGLQLSGPVAAKVGVPGPGDVVVTPLLTKGSALPAQFRSTDALGATYIGPGEHTFIRLVVFDDPESPFVQEFSLPHPGGGSGVECVVVVAADPEGVLTCTVETIDASPLVATGRLVREGAGPSCPTVGPRDRPDTGPVVDLHVLSTALAEIRGA